MGHGADVGLKVLGIHLLDALVGACVGADALALEQLLDDGGRADAVVADLRWVVERGRVSLRPAQLSRREPWLNPSL